MFRKDILIQSKHWFLLILELLIPALLYLTICDNTFVHDPLTEKYEPQDLSSFDLSKRSLAYYPSNSEVMVKFVKYISEFYNTTQLDSDVLVPFESEEQLKNFILNNCSDCFWASFTFNEFDAPSMNYTYVWRVNQQFISDQETGTNADRLWDPITAENIVEYATTRYFMDNADIQKTKNINFTSLRAGVGIRKFPDVVYYDPSGIYNKMGSGAPVVLSISFIFSFFAFTYQIVQDKQLKLRQSLHTIGLSDSAFWMSQFTVAIILAALQSLIINIVGIASGWIYYKNSPWLLNFFIIWLGFLASHTFAMLIASMISQVRILAFIIFLFLIIYLILGSLCTNHKEIFPEYGSASGWQAIWISQMSQALYLISLKAIPYIDLYFPSESQKFTWKDSYTFTGVCTDGTCDPNGYDCGYTVAYCIGLTLVLAIVHLLLAAYIDLVTPAAHGSRLKLYEPFTPEFWSMSATAPPPPSHMPGYVPPEPNQYSDSDVKFMQECVLSPPYSAAYKSVADDASIIIYDLNVQFKNNCAPGHKKAVNHLSFAIKRNSVLGLLGKNGAGKTTTLSVITGHLRPTSGYVSVEGLSCVHQRRRVNQLIGYCPQFDVLWSELSPEEHIKIFSNLRGLDYQTEIQQIQNARQQAILQGLIAEDQFEQQDKKEDILDEGTVNTEENELIKPKMSNKQALDQLVKLRLQDMNLLPQRKIPCRALSGGMRRRVTLMLSLVGQPPILLLDEMTTGLDPISRHKIYDVIIRSKLDRTILLTTHSLEEAQILSDNIAILAYGTLRCFGTASHLKRKYGLGYRIDVNVSYDNITGQNDVLKMKDIVDQYMPEALLVARTGGSLTLAVPRAKQNEEEGKQKLLRFLQELEKRSDIVKSWGIRQTTLEEIFLAVSAFADKVERIRETLEK